MRRRGGRLRTAGVGRTACVEVSSLSSILAGAVTTCGVAGCGICGGGGGSGTGGTAASICAGMICTSAGGLGAGALTSASRPVISVNAAAVSAGAGLAASFSTLGTGSGLAVTGSVGASSNAMGADVDNAGTATGPSVTLRLACSAFFKASINRLMAALRYFCSTLPGSTFCVGGTPGATSGKKRRKSFNSADNDALRMTVGRKNITSSVFVNSSSL